MSTTTTREMIQALAAKLGSAELRKRIDELRRDPSTGFIVMGAAVAIAAIYDKEFPNG